MQKIREGLHLIPENQSNIPDSNVYVIGTKEEFFLIDAGNGFHSDEKKQSLKDSGFSVKNCKAVIVTHLHFDHTYGLKDFNKPIWMYEDAAKEYLEHGLIAIMGSKRFEAMGTSAGLQFPKLSITRKLTSGETLDVAGQTWTVIHTPGHSKGSICLYNKETQTLISGDTVFKDSIGRMDLYGGSEELMLQSLNTLQELKISTLLPGHGPTIINDENYIKKMIEKVKKLVE